MDYKREVEKDAVDFLTDHEEMVVKALKDGADWNYNDIDDLDSAWHEEIVDRAYSLEDAAYIMTECENREDDILWDPADPDAICHQAAYSYANDVWFKCEELYDAMKERMEELKEEFRDDGSEYEKAAQAAFDEFKEDNIKTVVPVEKDSPEELSLIREWLRRNRDDAGMRGGYPVGSSYIDARCGTGHGMPDVYDYDYVEFDHEFAKKVPWLAGKYKDVVQARCDELLEKNRETRFPDWSVIGIVMGANWDGKPLANAISEFIMEDKRLSVADIREIAQTLLGKVG